MNPFQKAEDLDTGKTENIVIHKLKFYFWSNYYNMKWAIKKMTLKNLAEYRHDLKHGVRLAD
jgi:hypothetical protein